MNALAIVVQIIFSSIFMLASEGQSSVLLPVYPRFNELQKITVGPDDQLDASVDSGQKLLVFTHRANMISHLRIQELATGKVQDLLPSDADSTQAKFNDQGQIVFVYFKQTSRGDICYTDSVTDFKELPLASNKIHCLPRSASNSHLDRTQPFWLGRGQIGFLEENEKKVNIVTVDLSKINESVNLVTGQTLIAPSGSADGRFLVFTQLKNNQSQLVLQDRSSGEQYNVPIALPGVSGFASFTEGGEYVYFSHFMGDSNQDSIINGNDNSVVWRISVKSILDFVRAPGSFQKEITLEQITPMDLNCSFAVAKLNQLFLTCAFEGSLDIYSLPPEGIVPKEWDTKMIEDAIESARSYQDRILLVNTLKAKISDTEKKQNFNERLFNLHLLADEVSAASYYSISLNSVQSLKVFLKARLLKKTQPMKAKTFLFKETVHNLEGELAKVKKEEGLKSFVRAYLLAMQGRRIDLTTLNHLLSDKAQPIQYWLYYAVAEELYPKEEDFLKDWIKVLKVMTYNTTLSIESRLYYAFELLQLLEPLEIEVRKKTLLEFTARLDEKSEVRAIVDAEIYVLELIQAAEKKDKTAALQKIDQLMMKYKSQYFVRKAINIRAVLNFLNHQQFRELSVIAANWLRDTPATSTEFSYAREVVISAAREQGYGYWTKPNARLASDYFFQSLSLTDDLESYSGYVNTMLELGQRKNMEERLEYLRSHQVMKDGVNFVKGLLALQDGSDEKALDAAISELEGIRADLIDPMRTLLIGYVYLEKFLQTKKGLDYDRELWQKAHHYLILTADLARGRQRIRAAAFTNLGLLHLLGQNYGQSVRFFELRKQLGFDQPLMNKERQAFAWFYSQALFLAGQSKLAAAEIAELPGHQLSPEFMERKAFYLAMGDSFPEALQAYESLQKVKGSHFESLKEPARTKVRLGLAYTLFQSQRFSEAKMLFEKVVTQDGGHFEVEEGARTMAFEPDKIQAIGWGFLAQMGTEEEMIRALRERIKLVEKNDLPASMQAKMRLAELISPRDASAATELMKKALEDCQAFTADNGHLGQGVFRTLSNYMVHGLLYESQYKGQKQTDLRVQVTKTLEALDREADVASIPLRREHWRLQYLWSLFQERILNESPGPEWREQLNKTDLSERLRQEDEKMFEQLKNELSLLE